MKLTLYKKILKMGKDAVRDTLAPVRANEMQKRAELEIAKMDSKLAEQEAKIQETCAAYPVDFDAVIRALDDYALMERRRKQFEKIKAEMFGKDEE
jgi:hypothetical protein